MKTKLFYLMSTVLILFLFTGLMKTEVQVTIGEATPSHPSSLNKHPDEKEIYMNTNKGALPSQWHAAFRDIPVVYKVLKGILYVKLDVKVSTFLLMDIKSLPKQIKMYKIFYNLNYKDYLCTRNNKLI